MKGIVLAGGSGTRLYPMTRGISKQLLPIYDKPLVYYPISILMMAGIKDIMIISSPRDLPLMQELLGDGSELGVNFEYKLQPSPDGIAQAFILGEEFIGNEPVSLVLGDNIYHGHDLMNKLRGSTELKEGGKVFAYQVFDPERYGVIDFDEKGKALSIEEKPENPKSNYAVTGLYFYDNKVVDIAKDLKPSARGELEITDVNKHYLEQGSLTVELLGRGYAWLDTGTPDSMAQASDYIKTLQARQGTQISCLEEIAYMNNFIDLEQLDKLAKAYKDKNDYGKYLTRLVEQENL